MTDWRELERVAFAIVGWIIFVCVAGGIIAGAAVMFYREGGWIPATAWLVVVGWIAWAFIHDIREGHLRL